VKVSFVVEEDDATTVNVAAIEVDARGERDAERVDTRVFVPRMVTDEDLEGAAGVTLVFRLPVRLAERVASSVGREDTLGLPVADEEPAIGERLVAADKESDAEAEALLVDEGDCVDEADRAADDVDDTDPDVLICADRVWLSRAVREPASGDAVDSRVESGVALCETLMRGDAVATVTVDDRVSRVDVDGRGLDETLALEVEEDDALDDRETDGERDTAMVTVDIALSKALPVRIGVALEEYDARAELDATPTDCVGELSELDDASNEDKAESLGL